MVSIMKTHYFTPGIMLTAILSACVSVGTEFDSSKLNQLKPGTSKIIDANQLLGSPNSISTEPDGSQVLVWTCAKSSIGKLKKEKVTIIFDSSGKMVRIGEYRQQGSN